MYTFGNWEGIEIIGGVDEVHLYETLVDENDKPYWGLSGGRITVGGTTNYPLTTNSTSTPAGSDAVRNMTFNPSLPYIYVS